ncbi:hypothetical protein D3C71_1171990 [compost metagenome]
MRWSPCCWRLPWACWCASARWPSHGPRCLKMPGAKAKSGFMPCSTRPAWAWRCWTPPPADFCAPTSAIATSWATALTRWLRSMSRPSSILTTWRPTRSTWNASRKAKCPSTGSKSATSTRAGTSCGWTSRCRPCGYPGPGLTTTSRWCRTSRHASAWKTPCAATSTGSAASWNACPWACAWSRPTAASVFATTATCRSAATRRKTYRTWKPGGSALTPTNLNAPLSTMPGARPQSRPWRATG